MSFSLLSYLFHSLTFFSVAIPAKSSRVTILKPRSVQIDVEHHLNLYHRIVRVSAFPVYESCRCSL